MTTANLFFSCGTSYITVFVDVSFSIPHTSLTRQYFKHLIFHECQNLLQFSFSVFCIFHNFLHHSILYISLFLNLFLKNMHFHIWLISPSELLQKRNICQHSSHDLQLYNSQIIKHQSQLYKCFMNSGVCCSQIWSQTPLNNKGIVV